MDAKRAAEPLIRVYRLPEKLTNGFCFGGGTPIPFINVDWFNAEPPADMGIATPTRDELTAFIKSKVYWDPSARFLVLDDRTDETFVIERATLAKGGA
jgi:hypothetical protein